MDKRNGAVTIGLNNSHRINIRITRDVYVILEQIAQKMNQNPTTLCSQIVTQWIDFYYYKIHRGDIVFAQQIVRKFLEIMDKSRIDDVSQFTAQYMVREIKMQEDKIDYSILVDHIMKWNQGNHLILDKFEKDTSDVFVSRHNLGKNWSELECKMYTVAFEIIGHTIIARDFDSEDTFSFEVVKKA